MSAGALWQQVTCRGRPQGIRPALRRRRPNWTQAPDTSRRRRRKSTGHGVPAPRRHLRARPLNLYRRLGTSMAPGHERSDDELQEAAMRNRRRSAPESASESSSMRPATAHRFHSDARRGHPLPISEHPAKDVPSARVRAHAAAVPAFDQGGLVPGRLTRTVLSAPAAASPRGRGSCPAPGRRREPSSQDGWDAAWLRAPRPTKAPLSPRRIVPPVKSSRRVASC